MKFVFGRTFICEDDRDAREITFNKSVDRRDRCVSSNGLVLDLRLVRYEARLLVLHVPSTYSLVTRTHTRTLGKLAGVRHRPPSVVYREHLHTFLLPLPFKRLALLPNQARSWQMYTHTEPWMYLSRCRSVTMQGDVFDLSGTLEGGAVQSQSSILESVSHLADVSAQLEDKRAQLKAAEAELAAMAKVGGGCAARVCGCLFLLSPGGLSEFGRPKCVLP